MPDFPIIDSHVHLYDVARLSYGWLAGVPAIAGTHGLPDFDAARGGVAVDGIVFAEVAADPGLHVREAALVQAMADADPRLRGMVAHAPVEKGAALAEDLAALSRFPTLRGVRRLIETERDPGICLEPAFLEGVQEVGRHGLTFDICIKHFAMAYALELIRRCPDVQFVLDHIGKPGIRHRLWEPWRGQMRDLAALPNVVVKLSGVITEADHASWTEADIRPYVAHVIDCFGFDRVMYGSDWPVSELTHRYPDWVGMLDRAVAGASGDELRRLYRGTAIRVYRLPLTESPGLVEGVGFEPT
jgi:L-fuconolactonase